jgi:hypothetical protein
MELAWCKYLFTYKISEEYILYLKNIFIDKLILILGLGIAIGPLCASIFYYIGGYVLPYVVCALAILICIPLLNNLNLSDDEEGEVPQFMTALWNPVTIIINITNVFNNFIVSFRL